MELDIGPVGIWGYGNWHGDDAAEAVAELDELGYGALWLGSSDGGLELHEALLAASRRIVVATAIINIWVDPPARVAASYQRVERSYPGRMLIGLGSSHAGMTQGQEYRPYQKMVSYLDELDALHPTVPTGRRVLAALGPKMLRLAAGRSAGAHPYLVTPAHTKKARDILGPGPLLAPEQKVILETDPVRARAIARETSSLYLAAPNYTRSLLRMGFTTGDLAGGGSDRLIDAVIAWGDTGTVLDRIAEHHAAGADHVAIQVLTSGHYGHGPLPRQQWRELAAALKARTQEREA
jgi:probable F420-dependent oxidoreductase